MPRYGRMDETGLSLEARKYMVAVVFFFFGKIMNVRMSILTAHLFAGRFYNMIVHLLAHVKPYIRSNIGT